MKKVLSDCGSREGASEADIEFIRGRNLPESKPQKCLTACVGEDAEMVRLINSVIYQILIIA